MGEAYSAAEFLGSSRTVLSHQGSAWQSPALLRDGQHAYCPFVAPGATDGADEPVSLALEIVASGLNLPVYATAPPGDTSRVFVLELYSGLIRIVKNGVLLPTPFLDLSSIILAGGERGLLGLAFHPNYANNRRFYVFYNGLDGSTNLARYRVSVGNPDVAQTNGKLFMTMSQPFAEHNGGMLQFGPDGMLYISTGDGGGPLDPLNNAQDLSSPLGKILRINVNGGNPYQIPPDNPFLSVPGALPEIFAYGLRNPWRFSIDQASGALFIGDVGADSIEEINFVPGGSSGQNFGWRCKEGTYCTGQQGCSCPSPGFTDPIFEYFHSPPCAVIGGFVYRGQDLSGHAGRYFFTDYCDNSVVSFAEQGGMVTDFRDHTADLIPPDGSPLILMPSFGLDGAGELLIVSLIGNVYRIVPQTDCDGDGIGDATEIAMRSAFDANLDGVPDDCQQLLQGNALSPGQNSWLWFVGAQPGQAVLFFFSLAGLGSGPCFFNESVCLDLAPFSLSGGVPSVPWFGTKIADAQGAALLPLAVPPQRGGAAVGGLPVPRRRRVPQSEVEPAGPADHSVVRHLLACAARSMESSEGKTALSGLLLGFDLGGTKIGLCVGDASGRVFASDRLANDPSRAPEDLLDEAVARLHTLHATVAALDAPQPLAVGVPCPGPFDPHGGQLLAVPNMPRWQGFLLRDAVAARLDCPVAVMNDANASVLAEWRWGAARDAHTAVFLTMSTGMGAGLLVDGRVLAGPRGMAGEIGHWRLSDDGPVGFGKHGSVEGWLSGPGIVLQARAEVAARQQAGRATLLGELDHPLGVEDVCAAARAGDEAALAVTRQVAARLGQLCALLVDLLDPDVIVLGTIASAHPELFLPGARAVLDAEALPDAAGHVALVPSGLPDRADQTALSLALTALESS